jgi:dipeptidyl aminopeptidase/acylaminoacyl peptidase
LIEKVTYRSGPLIFGQVCRPNDSSRHRVVITTHGGFSGLNDAVSAWNGGQCEVLAQLGWVVLESSYRGEDESDGRVEVCLGEVDDVLAMARIGLAQAYVDPQRVGLFGGSHGGCVGMRAVERGIPVQAAVDVFGATDWRLVLARWDENALTDPNWKPLADFVRAAIGGTPTEVPIEYDKRSTLHFASQLEIFTHPLMILHGVLDDTVPLAQSCELVTKLSGVMPYHITDADQETTAPASGCPAVAGFAAGTRSALWPDPRYFMVYDGAGHDGPLQPGATALYRDAYAFLMAKIP